MPFNTSSDVTLWENIWQYYKAIDERLVAVSDVIPNIEIPDVNQPLGNALCCGRFPKPQTAWGLFIVSGHTVTTITPDAMPTKCGGINPVDTNWTSGCSGINAVPDQFDIIVHNCDPRKVVRCRIVSNTSTTFTIESIERYFTAGWVEASDIDGSIAYLIKRGGPWYSDRIMRFPNDREYVRANPTSVVVDPFDATKWLLTFDADTVGMSTGALVGKDLLVNGSDSKLHRTSVVGNDVTTIRIAKGAWTPSGTVIVIDAGGKGDPDNVPDYAFLWDMSPTVGYYSHYPNDFNADETATNPPATDLPSNAVGWEEGAIGVCDDKVCLSWEGDCWSTLDNECSEADKNYNRDLYRTIRGLQLGAIGLHGSFADEETGIPFSMATWLYRAGVNAQSASSSGGDADGLYVSLDVPYTPIEVHYAVLGSLGCIEDDLTDDQLTSGTALYDGTKIPGNFSDPKYSTARTVIVSLGFTRVFPKEFRYRKEATVFVADMTGTPAINPKDPPEVDNWDVSGEVGVGYYRTRGVSTTYLEVFNGGLGPPIGSVNEGADAFQNGDKARWVGDNLNDPANYLQWTVDPLDGKEPRYYDRMYEGRHPDETHVQLLEQLRGSATEGGSFYLTQSAHNWWHEIWYPLGEGHDETGTATSGSTTSLSDNTKVVDTEAGAFFSAYRWGAFAFPYEDFVLEVNIAGVWHKRRITGCSQSGGGVIISWAEPLPATANGKQWRIREAYGYKVNRFKGLTATLTEPDGTEHTVTITANDDRTICFATQAFTVAAGWTFAIDDLTITPSVGGVYTRTGGQWVLTEGAKPDVTIRFGTFCKGDYIGSHIFSELRACLSAMKNTWKGVTVLSREDDDVPELNEKEVFYVGTSCTTNTMGGDCTSQWSGCWGEVLDCQTAAWNGPTLTYSCLGEIPGFPCARLCGANCVDDGEGNIISGPDPIWSKGETADLPYAYWAGCACESMCGVAVRRRYCYVLVEGISTCTPVTVEIWGRASMDGFDCPSQIPVSCVKREFSTNSDGGFRFGRWGNISTTSTVSDTGSTQRIRIGLDSFPLPDRPPLPNVPGGGCSCRSYKGYEMADVRAILKWSFTYA